MNPDLDKLGTIGQAVRAGCGETPPTQIVVGVAGLAVPDILFEVEAVAARPRAAMNRHEQQTDG